MAGSVLWRRSAEGDLAEAYLFIGVDSPAAAERWLDAVEAAVQFLDENRGAGREREPCSPRTQGIRSWRVQGFPAYVIFYRGDADELEVLRLLHGARDIPRLVEEEA